MGGGTALQPKVVAHPKDARIARDRQIRRARQAQQRAAMSELPTLPAVRIKHRRVISFRNAISGTDFLRGRPLSMSSLSVKATALYGDHPLVCSSTPRVKSLELLESKSQNKKARLNTHSSCTVKYFIQTNSAYLSICILAGGPARLVELSYQECHRCR